MRWQGRKGELLPPTLVNNRFQPEAHVGSRDLAAPEHHTRTMKLSF